LVLDDPLTRTVIVIVPIAACLLILYAMRGRRKRTGKAPEGEKPQAGLGSLPFKITKSISSDEAGHAKDELRILELEREILSDAIRRLYEAHAEGKITEEERERLAKTYKSRMMTVKDAISKDESVVALHELEAMQEDLMKLFSERFDELAGKIEELRVKTETKRVKEISVPIPEESQTLTEEEKPAPEEKSKRKRRAPSAKQSPRSEAERRIEEIREEVEKVLDRLGQMEIES
jgi:hypothetical protein